MTKLRYISVISILFFIFLSCEDNVDENNPLIGKWRYEHYKGNVETNDTEASALIKNNIESINNTKQHIMQYQFMVDSIFVLFDINSDYKVVGKYSQSGDSITFKEDTSSYWAIKYNKKYFDLYIKDVSADYTPDSLQKLGVKNPSEVIIKKAWLTAQYKRI